MRFKVEPWAHQREAMRRASAMREFALFFEMGAGKTATVINMVREKLNAEKRLMRTLVLAPPIVLDNWRQEWLMHSDILPSKLIVLSGHNAERTDRFIKAAFSNHEAPRKQDWTSKGAVIITNYEALQMPLLWKELQYWRPEIVICDEAHRIKDVHSKRGKACKKLGDDAFYRYVLTGTPILNSLMDMFGIFRFLDRGNTFGHSFTIFRAKYFFDANAKFASKPGYFPKWEMKPDSARELRNLIEAKSMRVEKSECMDLPPLTRKIVTVDLSKEQLEIYQAMRRDFIAYVGSAVCNAPLAITRALRMLQIVSGFVALETFTPTMATRKNFQIADNPRAAALKQLLSEILAQDGSKVIIWAVFRDNYVSIRRVLEELNTHLLEVHGEISTLKKEQNIFQFQNVPEMRVLMAHPASAGVGVNLQAANYAIFYSRTFSLEHDLQAEARNHRGGSEIHQNITRIDLIARGTIDELVHERLKAKVGVSEAVLKDLGRELKGRRIGGE